jgi:hypothetical protein
LQRLRQQILVLNEQKAALIFSSGVPAQHMFFPASTIVEELSIQKSWNEFFSEIYVGNVSSLDAVVIERNRHVSGIAD